MTDSSRKFTNKQVVGAVAALCLAIGVAPAGAVAAGDAFTIADPVHPAQKARVDSHGRLLTSNGGASTVVSDGSRSLTVDGSVRAVTIPSSTWYYPGGPAGGDGIGIDLTPLVTTSVNLSDLSVSNEQGTQPIRVTVWAYSAPRSSSVSSCASAPDSTKVWTTSVAAHSTLNMPFAVPLRTTPSATNKVCFYANTYSVQTGGAFSSSGGTISANGSYGS